MESIFWLTLHLHSTRTRAVILYSFADMSLSGLGIGSILGPFSLEFRNIEVIFSYGISNVLIMKRNVWSNAYDDLF